jgi:hypothetical protein
MLAAKKRKKKWHGNVSFYFSLVQKNMWQKATLQFEEVEVLNSQGRNG